ncbi:26S proteasome regulatory subunit N7 [Pseudohyphozyma bogoriensis]|nr:26S proteasome regulatory subunit N7 [Pseudohyphozyma bogoriensis]
MATTVQPTGEETVQPFPNLKLPQHAFVLEQPKASSLHPDASKALLAGIEADEMAPYLSLLLSSSSPVISPPSSLLSTLQEKNKTELTRLEEKLEDAEKNLGETEISDALREKASYLARIGDKDDALKAYQVALEKTAGLGSKIDIRLSMVRIGFFHGDHDIISSNIAAAQTLVDEGGDWDRRNRLKAYNGLHLLSIRNFKQGGELLLDTVSTFTATELIDYDDFVTLCVLAGVMTLERRDLKKKIIDSPEVIALIPNVPTLKDFCDSLYKCEYATFFKSLATVEEHHLLPSRLLSVHARYYVREMRIKAYGQLLESYRSVTMKNLCDAFGVGEEFMDADLSRFIAAGRLNCSIDRVNGVVETNRPDAKNARYEAVVKQGDVLLTSVQRLSRVIG